MCCLKPYSDGTHVGTISSIPSNATIKLGKSIDFICTCPFGYTLPQTPKVCTLISDGSVVCLLTSSISSDNTTYSVTFFPFMSDNEREFNCTQTTGTVKINVQCMLNIIVL